MNPFDRFNKQDDVVDVDEWLFSQNQARQQTAKPKKRRNFWLDQISTLTGTIGGIGGGVLGAAAGGVGAVPGAAAGGAAGAGLGEWIENLIDKDTGDWGNVAQEAVLGGVFAGGPIKLGKMGVQAGAKALGKKAAEEAAEGVTRSAGQRATQNLLGNAWNIKSGAKIGTKVLRPKEASELQNFIINNVGVPKTASADMVFENVARYSDETGKAISSAFKANPKPVNTLDLTKKLSNRFSKLLGVDGTDKTAQSIVKRVNEVRSPEDLWKLAKQIDDDLINFRRNPMSAEPNVERVASAAREEIRSALGKLAPETKALNKSYSLARQAEELVAPAANKPRGLNIFNNRVGGGVAQRGQAALGQLGSGVSNMASKPVTTGPKGIFTRQVGQNLLIPRSQQTPDPESELGNDSFSQFDSPTSLDQAITEEPQEQSPYSRENMLADMQRDPANADKYIAMYEAMQEIFGAPQAPKLNNTAVQSISDLETGLTNLDSLEQSLLSSGANQPVIGSALSQIPFNTEGKTLRAEIDRVKQVIGKALEGGVLRKEDEEKYARILPTINDTDEVARRKIAALRGDLQNKLRTFYTNSINYGGGGGSIEEALMSQASRQSF